MEHIHPRCSPLGRVNPTETPSCRGAQDVSLARVGGASRRGACPLGRAWSAAARRTCLLHRGAMTRRGALDLVGNGTTQDGGNPLVHRLSDMTLSLHQEGLVHDGVLQLFLQLGVALALDLVIVLDELAWRPAIPHAAIGIGHFLYFCSDKSVTDWERELVRVLSQFIRDDLF